MKVFQSRIGIVAGAMLTSAAALVGCQPNVQSNANADDGATVIEQPKPKYVVYQIFTRLFGNTNTTNKPWGTIEENGVGKFNDINDSALKGIKELGVTHVWYTGVPHHAVIRDYTEFGISNDDPDVVKGRAGSPYAVKDYYSVNPDLAENPSDRLAEFEALIARTHANEMKVLIDIVPNHVARNYVSIAKPEGVSDFGANDDTSVEYARDNNFYYVVGEDFIVPEVIAGYEPLGGETHPLADGKFAESPAKWTGNGARKAQPHTHDWYETVKVNYGVRPDGSKDFPELPKGYENATYQQHYEFWQQQAANDLIPNSWFKFRDITLYWTEKGVDGFRFDMSEMVPYEFWSFLNSNIKMKNPDAFLLAEIYNPSIYRDYLLKGKMDYLYDKVDFYDAIKPLMRGEKDADALPQIQQRFADIEHQLLHFLDNHDEQRLASPEFAGDMNKGKPALVVSTLISTSPMMIYFGQEVGEDGSEDMGFGDPSRTTIFDYAGVPAHQAWMNGGKFDGGALSAEQAALRAYYQKVLNFAIEHPAIGGNYADLHQFNRDNNGQYRGDQMAFVRWFGDKRVLVVSNFSDSDAVTYNLMVPKSITNELALPTGSLELNDVLTGTRYSVSSEPQGLQIPLELAPLQSVILTF